MWLDILTGTLLIIALLQGYKNGFIRAVISTFSLFLGLILAFQFAGWVAIWLKQQTKITTIFLPLIAFLIVLIGVLLALRWVTRFIQQGAYWLKLGWLNKLLGILLYAFIYFTMLSAFVNLMVILGVVSAATFNNTISYTYIQVWWPYCIENMAILLPSIKENIARFSHA
jgi:membrane protein required for colicin V production